MKKCLVYTIISIIYCSLMFGQAEENWKNYTDMKNVQSVLQIDGTFWAATSGGLFSYNQENGSFIQLTKSEGLNSQILSAITYDRSNNIWTGAVNGIINRFNPQTGTVTAILDIFRSDKTRKQINHLMVEGDSIYVSSDFGISVINSSRFSFNDTYIKLGDFPTESKIISCFKNDLIYACTEQGVAIQKNGTSNLSAPESWNSFFLNVDIDATAARKITKFSGSLYLATDKGVFKFTDSVWENNLLSNVDIIDITADNSFLYIITKKEIYLYDGVNITLHNSVSDNLFSSIALESGKFIIGSDNGIYFPNADTLKSIAPNGPQANLFNYMAVDNQQNLWSGTGKDNAGEGVYKFDGMSWTNFNKSTAPIFPNDDFHKVFAGNNDKVYFCSWGFGFIEYNQGEMIRYTPDNSPLLPIPGSESFTVISAVQTDSRKNAWSLNFWTDPAQPLAVLLDQPVISGSDTTSWYTFSFSNPIISNSDYLDEMVIDQYDTKWFTVRDKGLYYFNENGTFEDKSDDLYGRLTTADGLTQGNITAIAVDRRGELWIGKNPGVNVLVDPSRPKTSIVFDLKAFRSQLITSIAVDAINRKWVGTKEGVFVMSSDGNEVLAYYNSSNSPIIYDDIKSIAIDKNNGITYIGTDFGVTAVKTSSVEPQDSFDELFLYPHPFIVGETISNLTIKGLVQNTELKILDINGKLVRLIEAGTNSSPGGSIAYWDGKDDLGNFVSTGIYFIVAYDRDATNTITSKVAVIRK